MNNTYSLGQLPKTDSLDVNLISGPYKLDLVARFMEIKSANLRIRQGRIAKELGCSSGTLQRYRQDINMLSPYRIPPNSHKRKQKISNFEHDFEKPQMTSKESSPIIETVKPKKNNLRSDANIGFKLEYSDEILHKIIL